jgi:uncharacterized heparinase superfamily protein
MLGQALRLFHTVRYLRPIQVTGRLAANVRRVKPNLSAAPPVRVMNGCWALPAWRAPSMLSPSEFSFLNETRELLDASDWNRTDWPRLWVYNLHYFDDLDALGAKARTPWHAALIARWITENTAVEGAGWEPYCLSLRIVNWCRWVWAGNALTEAALHSLAVQVRALADQIEVHLLGNHLFANAKALVFAGLFFKGPEAERWLRTGLRYLTTELLEQVLEDGAHFERSPMYHAIVACDVLELIEADRLSAGGLPPEISSNLRRVAGAMLSWAAAMSHPDGDFAFFNDAAFGIAPTAAQLQAMAAGLDLAQPAPLSALTNLWPSGYLRAASGPAILLADAGELGPDYLPGHAHADTLSFELSLYGRRLLVNTGTSEYVGARRLYERGTAAHNTVVVDGSDSSEVWSSFRVARRARPFGSSSGGDKDVVAIAAAHDGYRRLPGRVDHRRQWVLEPAGLTVEDILEGSPRTADAWFHLHPDIKLEPEGDGWCLMREGNAVAKANFMYGTATVEEGFWAPEFGRLQPNHALRVRFDGPRLISRWLWAPMSERRKSRPR